MNRGDVQSSSSAARSSGGRDPDHVLQDDDVVPDSVEERVLRHEFTRPLRQVAEDGEGLGPQMHGRAVPEELPRAQVEPKGWEDDARGGAG